MARDALRLGVAAGLPPGRVDPERFRERRRAFFPTFLLGCADTSGLPVRECGVRRFAMVETGWVRSAHQAHPAGDRFSGWEAPPTKYLMCELCGLLLSTRMVARNVTRSLANPYSSERSRRMPLTWRTMNDFRSPAMTDFADVAGDATAGFSISEYPRILSGLTHRGPVRTRSARRRPAARAWRRCLLAFAMNPNDGTRRAAASRLYVRLTRFAYVNAPPHSGGTGDAGTCSRHDALRLAGAGARGEDSVHVVAEGVRGDT